MSYEFSDLTSIKKMINSLDSIISIKFVFKVQGNLQITFKLMHLNNIFIFFLTCCGGGELLCIHQKQNVLNFKNILILIFNFKLKIKQHIFAICFCCYIFVLTF